MKLENEFLVWSLKVLNVVFCKRQREGETYNIQILLNAHPQRAGENSGNQLSLKYSEMSVLNK